MKNLVSSLMFSVSLFAASQAFAMQGDKDDNDSKIPPQSKIEQKPQGEGNFQSLGSPKKVILGVVTQFLDLKDIFNLSLCSKAMYNLINTEYSWKIIAKKYSNEFLNGEIPEGISQLKQYVKDGAPFSNLEKPYKVTIAQLLSFMDIESPTFMGKPTAKAYSFSIGKCHFEMQNCQTGSHYLDRLDKDCYVLFKKEICSYDPNKEDNIELYDLKDLAFGASVSVSLGANFTASKDLNSKDYQNFIHEAFLNEGISGNFFLIKRKADKEEEKK